jgi:hypothetical protein
MTTQERHYIIKFVSTVRYLKQGRLSLVENVIGIRENRDARNAHISSKFIIVRGFSAVNWADLTQVRFIGGFWCLQC